MKRSDTDVVSRIQVTLDDLEVFLHLPLALSLCLGLAIQGLVVFAFLLHSQLFMGCLHLVLILGLLVEGLPHFPDFLGDFCDPVAGEFIFDGWVDVHAVEEEGAHGFFGWFRLIGLLLGTPHD